MQESRWDIDLAKGHAAEQQTLQMLLGMAVGTVEVKRDERAGTTGNLFVEYQSCHHTHGWRPSGIATTEAEAWAFMLPPAPMLLVLPTAPLRTIARAAVAAGRTAQTNQPGQKHAGLMVTRGALIPLADLLTLTVKENAA